MLSVNAATLHLRVGSVIASGSKVRDRSMCTAATSSTRLVLTPRSSPSGPLLTSANATPSSLTHRDSCLPPAQGHTDAAAALLLAAPAAAAARDKHGRTPQQVATGALPCAPHPAPSHMLLNACRISTAMPCCRVSLLGCFSAQAHTSRGTTGAAAVHVCSGCGHWDRQLCVA
jgi:hypothetical protein